MDSYKVPGQTRIGHVHLKVANLDKALEFYSGLLGFEVTTLYGTQAAFVSAGGYHHHIGLNTWYSKDAPPALSGASDHGVSEALYLDDPDGNGLELYWDRPKEYWEYNEDGTIIMYTKPLNLESLIGELQK